MPRPYDPEFPEIGSALPDEVTPAPAPSPQAPPVSAPTPPPPPPPPPPLPQAAPAPATEGEVQEKWAFRSRTIQRMLVAGVMWYMASNHAALVPYVDQTLVADVVKMVFEVFGLGFLGAAARGRQIAGPEKLYWLPRPAR